jgi:hypothetical protein
VVEHGSRWGHPARHNPQAPGRSEPIRRCPPWSLSR